MAQATAATRFALEGSTQIVHRTIPGLGRDPGVRVALLRSVDGLTRAVIHPTSSSTVSELVIRTAVQALRDAGHHGPITTPALSSAEVHAFIRSGFAVSTELSLLRLDLDRESQHALNAHSRPRDIELVTVPRFRRHGRSRADWLREALAVDHAAFPADERFDVLSIDEALNATPRTWVRLACETVGNERRAIGYAISGRAGRRSYLQRLAVVPTSSSKGVGALLCRDAVAWAHARRATVLAVNTRIDNHRAHRLYERLGFDLVAGGLVVMTLPGTIEGTAPVTTEGTTG